MNFGPLNSNGGQRRLNVLITRAKQRCEVFTNLTADDIDLNKIRDALRHANISTTLVYARLGQDAAREAFERHGARIMKAAGKAGPVGVPGRSD